MIDIYLSSDSARFVLDKDPDARLDYTWDWSEYLADVSDTISSTVITPDTEELEIGTPVVVTGNKVVTFISGGTVNTTHKITCRINTTDGRVDERSIYLRIVEK